MLIRKTIWFVLLGGLFSLGALPEKSGDFTNLSLTYGYSMILNGFTDKRYLGGDQQDYIKAPNHNAVFEVTRGFASNSGFLNDVIGHSRFLLVGFQLAAYTIPKGAATQIPAIAELNADAVDEKIEAISSGGFGFFFGANQGNFEIALGTTVFFEWKNETFRQRRVIDANGQIVRNGDGSEKIEEVSGRGLFVEDIDVFPNARIRFGHEFGLSFTIDLFRELANLKKDHLNYYLRIPLGDYFTFDIGNGLLPNATLFFRPNFHLGNLSLHLKAATVLSTYQSDLTNIAITDGLYGSAAISYLF